jgi:hypothetical protein
MAPRDRTTLLPLSAQWGQDIFKTSRAAKIVARRRGSTTGGLEEGLLPMPLHLVFVVLNF